MDPDEFTKALARGLQKGVQAAFDKALTEIQQRARAKLGHYQNGWQPLSSETLERRARRGINPNDEPLLEAEILKISIQPAVTKRNGLTAEGHVGTDVPYGRRQELGYGPTPARPYLAPATVESLDRIGEIFKEEIDKALEAEAKG